MSSILWRVTHLLDFQPNSYKKRQEYKMINTIGTGSFGTVKLAIRIKDDEKVAIKIIDKSSQEGHLDIVIRELNILQKYQHENIVPFLDWFESKDKYYFVFKLCKGGQLLDRLLELGSFTELDCRNLIKQILLAVDYLHDNNLIHRDIKLENLLFEDSSENSKLLLTDFGISKILDYENQMIRTQCGTPNYTAPEIFIKINYGKPVDMWSIGVLTYLLLSGNFPYEIEGFPNRQLLDDMFEEKCCYDSCCLPKISKNAIDFIKKLLKGDYLQRMTIKQALTHPWIADYCDNNINLIQKDSKAFNAAKAYKNAFIKLKAVNALHKSVRLNSLSPDSINEY
ncbi:kinase-like protein [Neoconidiobolus thromboides FSU 785]|nr:kinase-like protein [Neoconidiobolus thromboides FSU 785]